jgi:hypothetical protein
MRTSQDIRTASGKLVGRIVRCEHGSMFVAVKRVPRGACVNLGIRHFCKPK